MSDYVIVGAGSAGCVLAARLSEDPDVTVLLLEAGPPDVKENVHVPLGYLSLAKTEVDWDYSTAPEPSATGGAIFLPRGKVLGGSSSINAMVYIRGNRRDYDGWGMAPGWSYDDLLPYFKRSEDNQRGPTSSTATGGPLTVSTRARTTRWPTLRGGRRRRPACCATDDFNGAEQEGVGTYQLTQRGGHALQRRGRVPAPGAGAPEPDGDAVRAGARIVFEGDRAVGVAASSSGETSGSAPSAR